MIRLYKTAPNPASHTCWASPTWDGTLCAPGECAGCDEANEHPCEYCGYGHVFTTHNPEPHVYSGDALTDEDSDQWRNSPHLYEHDAPNDAERTALHEALVAAFEGDGSVDHDMAGALATLARRTITKRYINTVLSFHTAGAIQ